MSDANSPTRFPQHGDEVYSEHGELGLYVSTAKGGGHIVQPLVEDGDGFTEPAGHYVSGVAIWSQVFSQPPRPKLDAKIAEQEKRLEALRDEIREAETEKRGMEAEQRAMKERLALHEQLTWIDDLLAGRFTHYLVRTSDYSETWVLMTAADFRAQRHMSQVRLQLWVSTHDRGESFEWRVVQGSSGDRFDDKSRSAIPFKSEAEAVARLHSMLADRILNFVKTAHANAGSGALAQMVQQAQGCGLGVPQLVLEDLRARQLRELQAERDKAAAALQAADQRLGALG